MRRDKSAGGSSTNVMSFTATRPDKVPLKRQRTVTTEPPVCISATVIVVSPPSDPILNVNNPELSPTSKNVLDAKSCDHTAQTKADHDAQHASSMTLTSNTNEQSAQPDADVHYQQSTQATSSAQPFKPTGEMNAQQANLSGINTDQMDKMPAPLSKLPVSALRDDLVVINSGSPDLKVFDGRLLDLLEDQKEKSERLFKDLLANKSVVNDAAEKEG